MSSIACLDYLSAWHVNSDAADFVLPLPERQQQCMEAALRRSGMGPEDIHIVSTHATSTPQGDILAREWDQ